MAHDSNAPFVAQAIVDMLAVTSRLDNGDESWCVEGFDLNGETVILDLDDGHTYHMTVEDKGATPRSPIKNARRKKK